MLDFDRIARRIAELRKVTMHVSQEQMAEDLNMYQSDISSLEHARSGSGIQDLRKLEIIAEYFNVSLEYLLFGPEKECPVDPFNIENPEYVSVEEGEEIPQIHKNNLKCFYGLTDDELHPVRLKTGNYTVYMLRETLSTYSEMHEGGMYAIVKLHCFVFYGDKPVGHLCADYLPLKDLVCPHTVGPLQHMIPFRQIDVVDVFRRLNPYAALILLSEDDEKTKYVQSVQKRVQDIFALTGETVLLIEEIYVIEDFRRKGVCTMLFDILRKSTSAESLWLNLEPIDWDDSPMFDKMNLYSFYSKEKNRQQSLNFSIAESLGFTLESDCWTDFLIDTQDPDKSCVSTIKKQKCAYILSEPVRRLTASDTGFVELGRSMQLMTELKKGEVCETLDFEFVFRKTQEYIYAQMNGNTPRQEYYAAKIDDDENIYFTKSPHPVIIQGKEGVYDEKCMWRNEDGTDMKQKEYVYLASVLMHMLYH